MSDQTINVAPIQRATPVAQVYKQAVKASAHDLPPAPKYRDTLPTDEEVLASTKVPTTLNPPVEKTEPAEVDTIDEVTEGEEEVLPVIESVVPEKNEVAAQAKAEVVGEKIQEFDLDNEEDTNFLKDLYKDSTADLEDTKSTTEKTKTSKVSEVELEEKYRPYKEKASEYEAVLADPMAKAFIEYLKSGKRDPNEFAKEAGFINIESLSPEQIMEQDFRNEGLTADEIAQELEAFEALSPYEKKKRTNSVKAELIQKRDEKLKTFTAGTEKVQAVQQQAVKMGMAQLNDLIPKMESKKYEGLLITPEMANSIKQYVISHPEPSFDEKGQFVGYDIKESISTAVTKLYKNEWKKSLVELGRTIGADKTLTARIRPNKKVATSAVAPVSQKSFEDIAQERADKQWKKRGFNPTKK